MTIGTRPTVLERAGAALAARVQRLPPPRNEYTIARDLPIPMRDGVELFADLYAPTGPCAGTILVRSPYGWPLPVAIMSAGVFAARGYRVILARCRGTFGSGGIFEPMVNEVDDAVDTVAWMREQAWFDGHFATTGGSYLGFTQWALLTQPPPELTTAVISIGPHDFRAAAYQGGAFNLSDFLGWSYQTSRQEDTSFARGLLRQVGASRRVALAACELPLVDASEHLLEGRAPWYREWASRRDPDDPWWSRVRLLDVLDQVEIPVLLQTGWQDLFLQQTLEQYDRLAARDIDVALTVGPWTHLQIATKGSAIVVPETLDWLDEHLGGTGIRTRAAPVKVFVTGANQWRDLPAWPPQTRERTLYLHPHDKLGASPANEGAQSEFTFDPSDPTPTVGGRVLAPGLGGYTDDSALALRRDLLTFTGGRLTAPLEIAGTPVVELAHSSDNPYVDLFVRISEVDAAGRSRNVSEGFVRLDPHLEHDVVRLELDAVAHRFAAGHRLRLIVAGGSHPRWERNLGTGDDAATSERTAPSHRTIDLAVPPGPTGELVGAHR